ncbi:MAG: hypothetical protein QM756_14305 [Polyangiaceae bacterium]
MALELLDGVRQKQPLGALLGYRFERALHENHAGQNLDQFIQPLRARFPLVAGQLTPSPADAPAESVAARNVVDGLALFRAHAAGNFDPAGLSGIDAAAVASITAELARVGDALDAVSDLGVTESVFQAVHGRTARSGATLDALSKGTTSPPNVEFVETPRTGVAVKHRVVIAVDVAAATTPSTDAWDAPNEAAEARQVRRASEPALEAWARKLLGDPERVRWGVVYDGAGSTEPRTLQHLGLSALDVIYGCGGANPDQSSDFALLLQLDAARGAPPGFEGAPFEIRLERDPSWPATSLTLAEFLGVARAIRGLIADATPANARHLSALGSSDPRWNLADLAVRATQARDALGRAVSAVRDAAAAPNALGSLREALLRLWCFGISGAVPVSVNGDSEADFTLLSRQAERVAAEADRRLQAVAALYVRFAAKAAPSADDYFGVFAELFERAFKVLPRFTLLDPSALQQSLQVRRQAADATLVATLPWFEQVSRVRPALERLERAFMFAECAGGALPFGLEIAQFPVSSGADRWAALAFANGSRIPGGAVSIAIHHGALPSSLDHRATFAGLIVDEWDDLVPNASETTAIALHYDAPAAAPPNAILVAVPPVLGRRWSVDQLAAIVRETLELAKIRSVDPDTMPETFAHFLPTSVLTYNAGDSGNGDTVATWVRPPA